MVLSTYRVCEIVGVDGQGNKPAPGDDSLYWMDFAPRYGMDMKCHWYPCKHPSDSNACTIGGACGPPSSYISGLKRDIKPVEIRSLKSWQNSKIERSMEEARQKVGQECRPRMSANYIQGIFSTPSGRWHGSSMMLLSRLVD